VVSHRAMRPGARLPSPRRLVIMIKPKSVTVFSGSGSGLKLRAPPPQAAIDRDLPARDTIVFAARGLQCRVWLSVLSSSSCENVSDIMILAAAAPLRHRRLRQLCLASPNPSHSRHIAVEPDTELRARMQTPGQGAYPSHRCCYLFL
jgi:hypothetical protein